MLGELQRDREAGDALLRDRARRDRDRDVVGTHGAEMRCVQRELELAEQQLDGLRFAERAIAFEHVQLDLVAHEGGRHEAPETSVQAGGERVIDTKPAQV